MKNGNKEIELEKLIEQGKTLYAGIDIQEKMKGQLITVLCIGLYLKKARDGEYKVTIDKSAPADPHAKHDSEKVRKFKLLNDAILYIDNTYSRKFIDMRLV
jgi:hypothetical protein